ncbi:MAG: energy-coupling factor transporter transmembrane component T [bacterium]
MKNIFEYDDRAGILYRIDPLIKIIFLPIFWAICFYADFKQLIAIVALVLAGVIFSGLGRKIIPHVHFFFVFVFPFIFLFHLFFHQSFFGQNQTLLFFNPSPSIAGLKMGLQVSLRLFCLLSSSFLFIATTDSLRLVKSLSKCGLPRAAIFFFVFINRSIFLIFNDLDQILDAQKARGFSLREIGLKERVAGYAGLLISLLTISLERAQKQAIALELKGFGSN